MAPNELKVKTPRGATLAPTEAQPPAEAPAREARAAGPAQAPAPRLAPGVELIGEFEDSGFKRAPYIARRRDGQVVQMPELLFRLAEQVDGQARPEQIAERFSAAIKRKVEPQDVQMLIEERLKPLGIVASGSGEESVELNKVDPLLALKFRAAVVPDRVVRSLTTGFQPLFWPAVMVAVVVAFVGLDVWLFFVHGISQSVRHILYQPALMLMLIGGVILATAFHEIGHATACRYGGAKPGVMGVGIYIVWPAFYTDITDAYRLGKWGRLRTDIGGMYFNAIFALVVAAIYFATGFEALLLLVVLQTFAIVQQALPLLRLDGYYILSDLTGVPDIFLRIRSVLTSLLPRRTPDDRVTELKTWVRTMVSVYVIAIVLFLIVSAVAMVINLPRVIATGYDSAALHYQAVGPDFNHGQGVKGALDVIEMLFLILPAAGLVYTGARMGRRGFSAAAKWSQGSPPKQGLLAAGVAAAVAVAIFSWLPNGQYRPIQPGERGTVQGLVSQVTALPTGRPSLTAARARQLGGAPPHRQLHHQSSTSPGATGSHSTPGQGSGGTSNQSGGSTGPNTTSPSGSANGGTPTTSTTPTTPSSGTSGGSSAGSGSGSPSSSGSPSGSTTPTTTTP